METSEKVLEIAKEHDNIKDRHKVLSKSKEEDIKNFVSELDKMEKSLSGVNSLIKDYEKYKDKIEKVKNDKVIEEEKLSDEDLNLMNDLESSSFNENKTENDYRDIFSWFRRIAFLFIFVMTILSVIDIYLYSDYIMFNIMIHFWYIIMGGVIITESIRLYIRNK